MRALEPTQSRQLTLAGFQINYEVYGDPLSRPLLLLPTWQIVHSRIWKMQIPYLARFYQVITFDAPGNGGGERTLDPTAYEYNRIVDQASGLLKYLNLTQADVIGFSRGYALGLLLAACHPEQVRRLVLIAGNVPATDWLPPDNNAGFWERRETYVGWEKYNANYWREHYDDWLEFFFHQIFIEPHSTKGIDDSIAWGLQTTPEILVQTCQPSRFPTLTATEIVARVQCPVLLIHGEEDQIASIAVSRSLAATRPDWEFVGLAGSGHAPIIRDPIRVNLLIAEFLGIC